MKEISSGHRSIVRLPEIRGIYFLASHSSVIYVGKSNDIHRRVVHHLYEGKKAFDSYSWIEYECSDFELANLEADWVFAYNPNENKIIPENSKYISVGSIERKYGIKKKLLVELLESSCLKEFRACGASCYEIDQLKSCLWFQELAAISMQE